MLKKLSRIDLILFLISLLIVFNGLDFPFYWDNVVQISVPANWYYETDFNHFYVPDQIATGHQTFVGMLFAGVWKIFGRTLLVSHLLMLPFVFGFLYQLHKLLINLQINNLATRLFILIFILIDATILSQLSGLTFEVFHLFFFLLCINAIIEKRNLLLMIAFVLLAQTSLRGTISAGGIMGFQFLYQYVNRTKFSYKNYLVYIPGLISIVMFLVLFKVHKGWVIANTVSNNWKESGELASVNEIARNIGVFGWRLIDFGRVFIFLLFAFLSLQSLRKWKFRDETIQILFLIVMTQFILFFGIVIVFRNPFGHRYLIPIMIPVIIVTVYWISTYLRRPLLWLSLGLVTLASGHFWLYPEKVSQGWDATTMHWNFFDVSDEMEGYLSRLEVDRTKIGTFFPHYKLMKNYQLKPKESISYQKATENETDYILYSNSFNVSDSIIDALHTDWELIQEFEQNRVFIQLLKRK
jgi:hypothetical protein